jgi:hypothetical protein
VAIISRTLTAYFTDRGSPALGLTPTLSIRESDGSPVASPAVSELGDGWYAATVPNYDTTKDYVVTWDGGAGLPAGERYAFGASACETKEAIAGAVLDEEILDHLAPGSHGEAMALIRGLMQHNFQLDQTTYNTDGLLLAGRLRVWDSAANVGQAVTGLLATYTISTTPEPGDARVAADYTSVKV